MMSEADNAFLHVHLDHTAAIYKSLLFFQVSDTTWYNTFTEYWNCSDIGWDDVWSRWCFPPCSLRSYCSQNHGHKITWKLLGQPFGCKIRTVQEPELTANAKKMFVPKPLAKGQCMPGVGSKSWTNTARCVACQIQLIFVCSLLLRWSLKKIILVLTGPYKVLIWLLSKSLGTM